MGTKRCKTRLVYVYSFQLFIDRQPKCNHSSFMECEQTILTFLIPKHKHSWRLTNTIEPFVPHFISRSLGLGFGSAFNISEWFGIIDSLFIWIYFEDGKSIRPWHSIYIVDGENEFGKIFLTCFYGCFLEIWTPEIKLSPLGLWM